MKLQSVQSAGRRPPLQSWPGVSAHTDCSSGAAQYHTLGLSFTLICWFLILDSGVEVMLGRALLWWGLLCPTLAVPRLPAPHYIQTDTGDQRFFQFSSGPGGQFRSDIGFHRVCIFSEVIKRVGGVGE